MWSGVGEADGSAILESLKHRNIVQLIQKIKDPKNERIYIVMEVSHPGCGMP